jgi:hypothetical protein
VIPGTLVEVFRDVSPIYVVSSTDEDSFWVPSETPALVVKQDERQVWIMVKGRVGWLWEDELRLIK